MDWQQGDSKQFNGIEIIKFYYQKQNIILTSFFELGLRILSFWLFMSKVTEELGGGWFVKYDQRNKTKIFLSKYDTCITYYHNDQKSWVVKRRHSTNLTMT